MAIPKIIHFCWMSGDPYPDDIQACIDSWKMVMPDYKLKLWNRENFNVNICQYTKEAMTCRKYAFVSDYIRLYALYHEGGIYLDSDVKAIRPFDELLGEKAFIGFESGGRLGPWLIASEKGNPLIRELLDYYKDKSFYKNNGEMDMTPNTVPVTNTLVEHGLLPDNRVQKLDDITIFSEEYFCPKNPWNGKVTITEKTVAMHLFKGAWNDNADTDLPFIASIDSYVKEFVKEIKESHDKVCVYGLGVVGRNVLEQLKLYKDISVSYVLVTKRDNGWKSVDGIPIIEVSNSSEIDRSMPVLVSTIAKHHNAIWAVLKEQGYTNIYYLGNREKHYAE